MAEWSCRGLQILVRRFDSGSGLQNLNSLSMTISIKIAEKRDIDAIVKLNSFVQAIHSANVPEIFHSSVDQSGLRKLVSEIVEAEASIVLLAMERREPLGYLWGETIERKEGLFSKANRFFYVHHIVVEPEARRKGIASSLFNELESHLVSQKTGKLVLDSWSFNEEAHRFFESLDFKAQTTKFSKAV